MFHYSDANGYKAISSQRDWTFRSAKPLGPHPAGAYFTPLAPDVPRLANRLRIPRTKTEFVFEFSGGRDLRSIDGGRSDHVLYSPRDYVVLRDDGGQLYAGAAAGHPTRNGGLK